MTAVDDAELTCADLVADGTIEGGYCCESCHEDAATDADVLDEVDLADGRVARVCCLRYWELESDGLLA